VKEATVAGGERASLASPSGYVAGLAAPAFIAVSAVFHYLGPAFAALLFTRLDPFGVTWLRIASAALVFAAWRRPWRLLRRLTATRHRVLLALGVVLAVMNTTFYLAIARLPLATVGSIEFLGVVVLAAAGVRNLRNTLALGLAVAGVFTLTGIRLTGEPIGFGFAFANCALFMLYVTLGHRIATTATRDGARWGRVDQLGTAMLIAVVVTTPLCLAGAAPAFDQPGWLLAGFAVGVCSSVIPYVTDQLAMARLHRATFAMMLSILPASATVIGLLVLAQLPTVHDLLGVALVAVAVAIHQQPPLNTDREEPECSTSGSARPV
jgi:inner membrane transporter RhtA